MNEAWHKSKKSRSKKSRLNSLLNKFISKLLLICYKTKLDGFREKKSLKAFFLRQVYHSPKLLKQVIELTKKELIGGWPMSKGVKK